MVFMNSINKNNQNIQGCSKISKYYLKHGIFMCELEGDNLPYEDKVLSQYLSSLPLTDSEYCISNLSALTELNNDENTVFSDYIQQYLIESNFKKIALLGYIEKNKTHQALLHSLDSSDIKVERFPTACHAKQWLLLPELEGEIWNEVSVLTF